MLRQPYSSQTPNDQDLFNPVGTAVKQLEPLFQQPESHKLNCQTLCEPVVTAAKQPELKWQESIFAAVKQPEPF